MTDDRPLTERVTRILNGGDPDRDPAEPEEAYPLVHAADGDALLIFDPQDAETAWIQSDISGKRRDLL